MLDGKAVGRFEIGNSDDCPFRLRLTWVVRRESQAGRIARTGRITERAERIEDEQKSENFESNATGRRLAESERQFIAGGHPN